MSRISPFIYLQGEFTTLLWRSTRSKEILSGSGLTELCRKGQKTRGRGCHSKSMRALCSLSPDDVGLGGKSSQMLSLHSVSESLRFHCLVGRGPELIWGEFMLHLFIALQSFYPYFLARVEISRRIILRTKSKTGLLTVGILASPSSSSSPFPGKLAALS